MHNLMIIFEWVIASSIMGSVLIGAILLTKALLGKKLGTAWHYYIWILLLIRLMIPYAPQSSFSIFNLIMPMMDNSVQTFNDGGFQKNVLTYESKKNNALAGQSTTVNGKTDSRVGLKELNITGQAAYRNINLNSLVMLIWLTGAIAFLLYMLILDIRFWLKIKRHCQYADGYVNMVLDECMLIMNVHEKLPILITKEIISPSIYGVIRPKLLLPYNLVDKVSHEELKYILLHELSHYKQKHILINCFAAAIKAVHWFNPIIWYGFYRMRQDCELECDAYVLLHIKPERRIEYGYAILSNELKAQEYKKYNDMYWVIGGSSPWVVDYTIKEKNKIDNETYEYEIDYTMTDSTRAKYNNYENITVKKSGNSWFAIKHDNYNYVPNITKFR